MKTKYRIHYLLTLITIVLGVVLIVLNTPNTTMRFDKYIPYANYIIRGFLWTILISICIFVLSFIIGFVMFFANRSKIPYIKIMTSHLTTVMFGTPMLVVVILFYYFIGTAINIDSKLFLGIVSLTLYFAPFMMKLYIGAYESIENNQLIVCDIFGFTKFQMYRYVILPQMIRIMMPPLSGNLATIIKSSSLLYLIGFNELYYNLTTVQAKTFAYTEGYLMMLVLYLIITVPLLKLTDILEKKVNYVKAS